MIPYHPTLRLNPALYWKKLLQAGVAGFPQMHFAIKSNDADISNGYLGFIDPSPYFGKPVEKPIEQLPQEQEPIEEPKVEEPKPEEN